MLAKRLSVPDFLPSVEKRAVLPALLEVKQTVGCSVRLAAGVALDSRRNLACQSALLAHAGGP
jgi:hypothetical protein